MASASIHTIPVRKQITDRLRTVRRPVLTWDTTLLAATPYPAFSGQRVEPTVNTQVVQDWVMSGR